MAAEPQPLQRLAKLGQSVWIDYLSRGLVDESRAPDLLVVGSRCHGASPGYCSARSASRSPTMPAARS